MQILDLTQKGDLSEVNLDKEIADQKIDLNNAWICQIDQEEIPTRFFCDHIENNKYCNLSVVYGLNKVKKINDFCFYDTRLGDKIYLTACEQIGRYSFYGCFNLKTVILNNAIDVINEYTFCNCTSLQSININKVKKLCKASFKNTNLTKVYVDNCSEIGEFVFADCKNLTNVIPTMDKLQIVKENCFDNCPNLDYDIYFKKFLCRKIFIKNKDNIFKNFKYNDITNFVVLHDYNCYLERLKNNIEYNFFDNTKYVCCRNPMFIGDYDDLKKSEVIDFFHTEFGNWNKYIGRMSGFPHLLKNIDYLCSTDYFMYSTSGWFFYFRNKDVILDEDKIYMECYGADLMYSDEYHQNLLNGYSSCIQDKELIYFLKYTQLKSFPQAILMSKKNCKKLYDIIVTDLLPKIDKYIKEKNESTLSKLHHIFLTHLCFLIFKNFKISTELKVFKRIDDSKLHIATK